MGVQIIESPLYKPSKHYKQDGIDIMAFVLSQVKVSYCASKPCQNEATCVEQRDGYACSCKNGYEGLQCQYLTNMCNYKKCHNGGECKSLVGSMKCVCAPGYSGTQCDTSMFFLVFIAY